MIIKADKRGGGWTVHKLIALILVAIILVVMIVGYFSGGLNPLFDRLDSYRAAAMGNLESATDKLKDTDSTCGDWGDADNANGISNEAQFRVCPGYCELKTDEETTYKFSVDDEKILKNKVDNTSLLGFDEDEKAKWNDVYKNGLTNTGLKKLSKNEYSDYLLEEISASHIKFGDQVGSTKIYHENIRFSSIEYMSEKESDEIHKNLIHYTYSYNVEYIESGTNDLYTINLEKKIPQIKINGHHEPDTRFIVRYIYKENTKELSINYKNKPWLDKSCSLNDLIELRNVHNYFLKKC
jgi:hypothetical protein